MNTSGRLARTQFTKFYLHSDGRANSVRGDGRLALDAPAPDAPPDRFVYDPAHPVYTLGGQISTNPEVWGPQDRQSVAHARRRVGVPIGTAGRRHWK